MVSRINEDAILGMPFLVAHNCAMKFNQPIVQMDGSKLKCTDWHCRLLVSSVQIIHELVVPPRTEMTVPSRVTTRKFCPLGVIEGQADRPPRKPPNQGQAKDGCKTPRQARKLARLLTEYSKVIITGDRGVGQTTLVEQSILAEVGPRPSISSEMPREKTVTMDICSQPLAPGYQIPRRTRVSPAPDTSQQNLPPAVRHVLKHQRFFCQRVRALGRGYGTPAQHLGSKWLRWMHEPP